MIAEKGTKKTGDGPSYLDIVQTFFDGLLTVCAIAGIGFAIYQMHILERQIGLAEKANNVAADAARAAEKAADESKRSNDIAADTAKKQLVAYFILSDPKPLISYDGAIGSYSAELKFKNVGQTPAYEAEADCRVTVSSEKPPIPKTVGAFGTIGPGREIPVLVQGILSTEDMNDLAANDTQRLLISIIIKYRDVFNNDPVKSRDPFPSQAYFIFVKRNSAIVGQPLMFELHPGMAGE